MNIIFFGTSVFAKNILQSLYESKYNITLCVTKEDAKKDRGQKLTPPPVKVYALENGLEICQVHSFKENEEFKSYFISKKPDLVCVASYGKILPEYILTLPKYGALNVHASLLPKYRGAAPIQRAIMANEKEIGVTIMQMDASLDTGDMIAKDSFIIGDDDNYETLETKLSHIGGKLLIDVIENIDNKKYTWEKQDDTKSSYAKKIEEDDRKIDFNESCITVFNKVRALYPDPCAYALLKGQKIKITKGMYILSSPTGKAGTVSTLYQKGTGYIDVNTKDGIYRILNLIPQGKGEMSSGDFIRGRKIQIEDYFE